MSVTDVPGDRGDAIDRKPEREPSGAVADDTAVGLIEAIQRQIGHVADLIASEVRLAAVSLALIIVLVVLTAASIIVGWVLFMAFAVTGFEALGVSPIVSTLVFAVAHLGLAYGFWRLICRLSRDITMPVARRVLLERDSDGD